MKKIGSCLLFALLCVVNAHAQLPLEPAKPLVGARQLALSPDGTRLAFVYQSDIWVVPSSGGMAVPVTNHIEMDENPVWSPDGNWIAFSSNRNGNNDVYIVPSNGGQSRRLTWWSGSDVPSDWTTDGRSILMVGSRDDEIPRVFAIDAQTTQIRQITQDFVSIDNPRMNPSGTTMVFGRRGFSWVRARYEGSGAKQLWSFDTASGQRKALRNNGFQHLWHNFAGDGKLYCVTVGEKTPSSTPLDQPLKKFVDSPARTPNVYEIGMDGSAKRMTSYVGGGVRWMAAARKAPLLAYEYEGDVYTMRPGQAAVKLAITASLDDKVTYDQRLVLTNGASQGSLSPKLDEIAFTVRGELWLVPVKKPKGPNADDARQLTSWAGIDEDALWHPDGKQLFFSSDRDGADRLYRLNVEDLKVTPVSGAGFDVFSARLTPDRKSLSYWQAGTLGGLYTVPLDFSSAPKRVFVMPGEFRFSGDPQYDWSPDMKWIAYVKSTAREGTMLMVANLETGEKHQINDSGGSYSQPRWSADARYLYYNGDRDGSGIYAVPLKEEDAEPTELELKYVKPTEIPKTEIDFVAIDRRIRRLISVGLTGTFRVDPTNGDLYYSAEGDLWKANYSGEDIRRLTGGGGLGDWTFSDDMNQAFFARNGTLNLLTLRTPQPLLTTVGFRADWTRDLRMEWRAAFYEFWRAFNRSFYDSNFHGRDWEKIRDRYARLLPAIGHRNEFSELLGMMVGELESSHSEVSPAGGGPGSLTSSHPGFSFDYSYQGPGLKIKDVPIGMPGSYAKTKLKPGEYVMSINGKEVRLDEALWRDVLNEQGGRDLTLLVNSTPSKTGARTVKYRVTSIGGYRNTLYQNRIDARRAYVEKQSGGKLTYVHIAGMGQGNFDLFNRQVWLASQGKKGVIIDVRDNGGGNIADRLVDVLERQPHMKYRDRDNDAYLAPGQTWDLPTVVMMNENSFSNAEMFPYAMKVRRLATLVGMPTPGYVIWTYGLGLIDGTNARMPTAGVFRLDGTPLENMGTQPDVKVDRSAEDYFAGRDPQLDKAIEILMKKKP